MTRRRRSARRPSERGAVALEFALVLPILVALMMCIVTVGLGYNKVLGLADGVHEGSRLGATVVSNSSWGATVQQQTIDLTYLTDVTAEMVCTQLLRAPVTVGGAFTLVWGSSNCLLLGAAPAAPAGVVAPACIVKVWARMPVDLTFILIPNQTVQVTRQAVSLYERDVC